MVLDLQLDYSCQWGQLCRSHAPLSDPTSPPHGLLYVAVFCGGFLCGFVCCFFQHGSQHILMNPDSGLKYPSLLLVERPLRVLSRWTD